MALIQNTNLRTYFRAAKKIGLKTKVITPNLVEFSNSKKKFFILKARTPINSFISVMLSRNKFFTSKILNENGVPCTKLFFCRTIIGARKALKEIGFPLVVKPQVGSKGKGITANINSKGRLEKAVKKVKSVTHTDVGFVTAEYIQGDEYRFLVLDNQIIGALKRIPPFVTGNGKNTIKKLIEQLNNEKVLRNQKIGIATFSLVIIDDNLKQALEKQNLRLNSIPQKEQKVYLLETANRASGGFTYAIDNWKEKIHPEILKTMLDAASALALKFAAIDVILKDIELPLGRHNGKIIEINSSPGINMFHYPDSGEPQFIAKKIINYIIKN